MEIPVINKALTTKQKPINSVNSFLKKFRFNYSEASSNNFIAEKEVAKLFTKYCRDVFSKFCFSLFKV
mgnify:FL=1